MHFTCRIALAFTVLLQACAPSQSATKSPRATQVRVASECTELHNVNNGAAGASSFFEVVALSEEPREPLAAWVRSTAVHSRQVAGLLSSDGGATEAPWTTQSGRDARLRITPQGGDEVKLSLVAVGHDSDATVITAGDQQPALAHLGGADLVVTRYRLGEDRRAGLSILAQCRK